MGHTDRHFMEEAIKAAEQCVAEDARRPRPKVGAVIVDGERAVTAFRGIKEPGEHAEFTLLFKLLPWTPTRATVYTTLEPCITRGHPKRPCADRIIERGGVERVVIGMLDPNPTITGKGVLRLREANIAVSLFDADLMSQVEKQNTGFIASYRPLSTKIAAGLLPLDGWRRTLDQWYVSINAIYFARNFHRDADSVLAHLVEVSGGLGGLVSGKKVHATEQIAKVIAWWMALCGKIGVKSVENMLWAKFPSVCPYCLLPRHEDVDCRVAKEKSREPNWNRLKELATENASQRPRTISEWQLMFRAIYQVREPQFALAKLTEELGELAEAVRARQIKPGYFLNEASDVFAWLMQLQNRIDTDRVESRSEVGAPLAMAFANAYPDRCARCHNQICSCSPVAMDTVGRIAHDMPVDAQALLSIDDTLGLFGGWDR